MITIALGILAVTLLTYYRNFTDVHRFQQFGYYMVPYLKKAVKTAGSGSIGVME